MGDEGWRGEARAMASPLRLIAGSRATRAADAFEDVQTTFATFERTCSRFDPSSALSTLNAAAGQTVVVPPLLAMVVAAAADAYAATDGRFDPRVLADLERLGYDRSFEAGIDGPEEVAERPAPPPWRPQIDLEASTVHLGGARIDLGGIAKGAALDAAAAQLRTRGGNWLLEAGGDLVAVADPTSPEAFAVGVEDPRTPDGAPVVLLELAGLACATSSTARRRWGTSSESVHHLIDPSTGLPGGGGLAAVTVVHGSALVAEVVTKAHFLSGPDHLQAVADRSPMGICWVASDGAVRVNPVLGSMMRWGRCVA